MEPFKECQPDLPPLGFFEIKTRNNAETAASTAINYTAKHTSLRHAEPATPRATFEIPVAHEVEYSHGSQSAETHALNHAETTAIRTTTPYRQQVAEVYPPNHAETTAIRTTTPYIQQGAEIYAPNHVETTAIRTTTPYIQQGAEIYAPNHAETTTIRTTTPYRQQGTKIYAPNHAETSALRTTFETEIPVVDKVGYPAVQQATEIYALHHAETATFRVTTEMPPMHNVESTPRPAERYAETTGIENQSTSSHSVIKVLNTLIAKQGKTSDLIPARALALDDLSNPGIISNLLAYLDSQAPKQANGRKQRVEINNDDDKAVLVKLCHENFQLYTTGKTKFFDLMRIKFWVATGGRLDVNVKGYMERWECNGYAVTA